MSNYFDTKIPSDIEIDVLVYQFGLRPTLPIMDFLYLEHIRSLSSEHEIKKVIIFPTIDKSRTSQSKEDFEQFKNNVSKVLRNVDFDIIDPFHDIYFNVEDLVSDEFLSTLNYLGSKKYFNFLKREFHLKINSINDFNQYRPVDNKIKDLYTHIYKCWGIVNYIKKNHDLNNTFNFSAIFWEWEVDKLGVLKHFSNSNNNISFFPILGKTQMLNKSRPLPVYVEDDAICIFNSSLEITNVAINFIPFISKYNSILESILKQENSLKHEQIVRDGKKSWEAFLASFSLIEDKKIKPTPHLFKFLGLVVKMQSFLNNGGNKKIVKIST